MQLKTYGIEIKKVNELFKHTCTGFVTIMEVADICDCVAMAGKY
jgi:hypothetical protein